MSIHMRGKIEENNYMNNIKISTSLYFFKYSKVSSFCSSMWIWLTLGVSRLVRKIKNAHI